MLGALCIREYHCSCNLLFPNHHVCGSQLYDINSCTCSSPYLRYLNSCGASPNSTTSPSCPNRENHGCLGERISQTTYCVNLGCLGALIRQTIYHVNCGCLGERIRQTVYRVGNTAPIRVGDSLGREIML